MNPLRHVLALDDDAPICSFCATALGGKPVPGVATASARPCGHCGNIRACFAVRDYAWPATLIRPEPQPRRHEGKPWQAPDDYDDLEMVLSRGFAPKL